MESPSEDVSSRSMRLKVLYTFDADSKNACLARWPAVLTIQTAFVDDLTQIGVVDLNLCLSAIKASSPEIFNQDTLDYTVYAFDYSEEGTPLSGQGMLSAIFDPTVQSNTGPSSKVVTGRITKAVLGFLGGSSGQESIEVKFRLLPVPKSASTKILPSPTMDSSFDVQGWPQLTHQNSSSSQKHLSLSMGSPVDTSGLESMQRMLHEGSTPREMSTNSPPEYFNRPNSRPVSRPGSPGQSQPFGAAVQPAFNQASRPASSMSVHSGPHPGLAKRGDSFSLGYDNFDENQVEDGPQRKRAKVMQIGAPSKSDLNIERQPESLRMVASTASSVRGHRPSLISQAVNNLKGGGPLEEPIRPPTPIPSLAAKPPARRTQTEPAKLRRGSLPNLQMPVAQTAQRVYDPVVFAATPPEIRQDSVASTPVNIPSSPPVMANFDSIASSPVMTGPAHFYDSGFYSEEGGPSWDALGFDEFTNSHEVDSLPKQPSVERDPSADILNLPTPQNQQNNSVQQTAEEIALPPPPRPPSRPSTASRRPPSRARAPKSSARATMSSPKLMPAPYPMARQVENGEGTLQLVQPPGLPPIAASDPVGPSFQQSNTLTGNLMSDLLTSDAATGEPGDEKAPRKKRIGRAHTLARCESALARNEMPPYCANCGAIDTPAWRTMVALTLPGELYESFEVYPNTNGFVWKQITEEADGVVKAFRAFKIHKGQDDKGDDWHNVNLCNPCGIWFRKKNEMRPEYKWLKGPKDPKEKKKRPSRKRSKRVAAKNAQEQETRSDAPDPGSEGSSPADGATEDDMEAEFESQMLDGDGFDTDLPDFASREAETQSNGQNIGIASREQDATAQSMVEGEKDSNPAQQSTSVDENRGANQHQSSTHINTFEQQIGAGQIGAAQNGTGNDGDEPNLTPKPLRRQLFSSPNNKRKSPTSQIYSPNGGVEGPLSEISNPCRRSPRLNKTVDLAARRPATPVAIDKENIYPESPLDDGLHDLFHDEEVDLPALPQTPSPVRRSERILLKTPMKTPSRQGHYTPGALPTNASKAGSTARSKAMEPSPITRALNQSMDEWLKLSELGDPSQHNQTIGLPGSRVQSEFDWSELPALDSSSPIVPQGGSGMNSDFDVFREGLASGLMEPHDLQALMNNDLVDPALSQSEAAVAGHIMQESEGKNDRQEVSPRRSPRKH